MFYRYFLVLFTLILTNLSCSSASSEFDSKPIPTVKSVELPSYLGRWYEVRRIKNSFQDRRPKQGVCYNVTAEYSVLPKGRIGVKNSCYSKTKVSYAYAKAKIVKNSHNAKLKVNFTGIGVLEWLGIGNGDYWILGLGELNENGLYSWSLVGSPNLKYGWILSRTPELNDSEIERALDIAESVGYHGERFLDFRSENENN